MIPRARLWVATVLCGAVAGAGLWFVSTVTVTQVTVMGGVTAFFLLLAVPPWLALSRRWRWWLGSVAGAVVGLIAAAAVLFNLYPPDLGICIVGPCPPAGPPAVAPLENLIGFGIVVGLYGAGQAVTLTGPWRKVGWFATSLVAGAVFGETFQLVSVLLGQNPAVFSLGPMASAGALCGLILATGASLLGQPTSSNF